MVGMRALWGTQQAMVFVLVTASVVLLSLTFARTDWVHCKHAARASASNMQDARASTGNMLRAGTLKRNGRAARASASNMRSGVSTSNMRAARASARNMQDAGASASNDCTGTFQCPCKRFEKWGLWQICENGTNCEVKSFWKEEGLGISIELDLVILFLMAFGAGASIMTWTCYVVTIGLDFSERSDSRLRFAASILAGVLHLESAFAAAAAMILHKYWFRKAIEYCENEENKPMAGPSSTMAIYGTIFLAASLVLKMVTSLLILSCSRFCRKTLKKRAQERINCPRENNYLMEASFFL